MKTLRIHAHFLLLALVPALHAQAIDTVASTVCFQVPAGNCLANATFVLKPSQAAKITYGRQVASTLESRETIPASTTLWGNDQLTPSGTAVDGPDSWPISGSSPVYVNQLTQTSARPRYPNAVLQSPSVAQAVPGYSLHLPSTASLTVNGVRAAGNAAITPASAIQYVSASGNDSNDGLSQGTAKATIGAAYAALPSCTANSLSYTHCGTIYVAGAADTSAISITSPFVSIVGVRKDTGNHVTITWTGSGCFLSLTTSPATNNYGVYIANLTIDGTGNAHSGACGIYSTQSRTVLNNVTVTNFSGNRQIGIWQNIPAGKTTDDEGGRWRNVYLGKNTIGWDLSNESTVSDASFGYGEYDVVCAATSGQVCVQLSGGARLDLSTIKLNAALTGSGTLVDLVGTSIMNDDLIHFHAEQNGGSGCVGFEVASGAYFQALGYDDAATNCTNTGLSTTNFEFSGKEKYGVRSGLLWIISGNNQWNWQPVTDGGDNALNIRNNGNLTAQYTHNAKGSALRLFGSSYWIKLVPTTLTNYRALTLPDTSGTVATTSQLPLSGALTTTAATRDALTITGLTSASHCTFSATNRSAAADVANDYISAVASNSVTLTHTARAGMTYNFVCTMN